MHFLSPCNTYSFSQERQHGAQSELVSIILLTACTIKLKLNHSVDRALAPGGSLPGTFTNVSSLIERRSPLSLTTFSLSGSNPYPELKSRTTLNHMVRMLLGRRERRSILVGVAISLGLFFFVWASYQSHSPSTKPGALHGVPEQNEDSLEPGHFGSPKQPTGGKAGPHLDEPPLPGTQLQSTDLETGVPMVPYKLDSDVKVGASTWGFNVLDKLYLRNGTFYIVANDRNVIPTKKEIIHRLGRFSTQSDEDDEGSEVCWT